MIQQMCPTLHLTGGKEKVQAYDTLNEKLNIQRITIKRQNSNED